MDMKVTTLNSLLGKPKLFLSPLVVTFLFSMFCFQSFGQNCDAKMKVYKGRDMKSATVDMPAKFKVELTNNAASSQTYIIESVNSAKSFTVEQKVASRLASNYKLNTTINYNGSVGSSITVPARSTVTFLAFVAVPKNTPLDKWGAVELKANSKACGDGSVSALLKVYHRNPDEN